MQRVDRPSWIYSSRAACKELFDPLAAEAFQSLQTQVGWDRGGGIRLHPYSYAFTCKRATSGNVRPDIYRQDSLLKTSKTKRIQKTECRFSSSCKHSCCTLMRKERTRSIWDLTWLNGEWTVFMQRFSTLVKHSLWATFIHRYIHMVRSIWTRKPEFRSSWWEVSTGIPRGQNSNSDSRRNLKRLQHSYYYIDNSSFYWL